MSSLPYDQLRIQILNYAQKEPYDKASKTGDENFDNAIPFFINLALEKIYRDVQTIDRNNFEIKPLPSGIYLIDKPPFWYQTISLHISENDLNIPTSKPIPLYKRTLEFCMNFVGQRAETPRFYADYYNPTGKIIISPTPDKNYFYRIVFTSIPVFLDLSNFNATVSLFNNSWVMNKYPSIVFYASYMEALRYMGKADEIPLYQGLYEQAIQSINLQNQLRNVDRTAVIEKV